ncbi:MAG: hypothetical protein GWN84_18260 [Gammaproteobacteria bacterium]|nr:hypothetical protein [Gammaproteobacteria bacterium]NIR84776.1 hypothetical protein [Gammaproteobacteria bacterium]NIR91295.1 hypothetical protein [Gammaproteobacteria bacterium]NIU05823.1 hypothetical protein [Gammaproteobacteria bacterium]NIV76483.1 hypothetical protein [Gammaproteobacteria bacterium]
MHVDFDLERLTTPVIDRITELFRRRWSEFPEFFAAIDRILAQEKERRGQTLVDTARGAVNIDLPSFSGLQSRKAILWCVGLRDFYDAQGYSSAAGLFHAMARRYQQAFSESSAPSSGTPGVSAA